MLSLPTGKLVHIDFTDIMEKLQDRQRWPEQVPSRLTAAFLRPLDVLGPDGEFKRHCVALLKALRDRADQIVELLSEFFEDPLSGTENLSESRDRWKQNLVIIRKKLTGVDARLSELVMQTGTGSEWLPSITSNRSSQRPLTAKSSSKCGRDGARGGESADKGLIRTRFTMEPKMCILVSLLTSLEAEIKNDMGHVEGERRNKWAMCRRTRPWKGIMRFRGGRSFSPFAFGSAVLAVAPFHQHGNVREKPLFIWRTPGLDSCKKARVPDPRPGAHICGGHVILQR
jgi:hypothetical protein